MVRLDLALHLEVRENEYFSSLILMEHCKGSEKISVEGEIKG
jgi:hypothetical protein